MHQRQQLGDLASNSPSVVSPLLALLSSPLPSPPAVHTLYPSPSPSPYPNRSFHSPTPPSLSLSLPLLPPSFLPPPPPPSSPCSEPTLLHLRICHGLEHKGEEKVRGERQAEQQLPRLRIFITSSHLNHLRAKNSNPSPDGLSLRLPRPLLATLLSHLQPLDTSNPLHQQRFAICKSFVQPRFLPGEGGGNHSSPTFLTASTLRRPRSISLISTPPARCSANPLRL
ncbi:hypothetical protein IE53DRAFT_155370 [Violaceomyces palustris]|uniref:Uncharacterized protein n=1 Tax=Violaceomyces palustris TaxID=1673888 RepID=A0ACD0NU32_9BASI|nr:hypothetical protein IE53DRAFT_155370 [Violaceomyces palustris]